MIDLTSKLLTECQARHVKRLLGHVHGLSGNHIPHNARYFWDGTYYPVSSLGYSEERDEVTMPDGALFHGDLLLYLYEGGE